jgi:predicted nucleic acid-binding protein
VGRLGGSLLRCGMTCLFTYFCATSFRAKGIGFLMKMCYFCVKGTTMKLRIYIDTSVVGGYFDEEFEEVTHAFFERIFKKDFCLYFSEVSEAELMLAPPDVRNLKTKIPGDCYKYLELDDESRILAETYIAEKILGKTSLDDAYHIAIATVNRLDVLVSWNFKHIVNFNKIQQFNSVNLKFGYPTIEIRSPKEFIHYEER